MGKNKGSIDIATRASAFTELAPQSLSVDQILEVVGKALEDHDQVNWQSPPISYNAERDKLLRARLIAKLNQPTK